MKRTLCMLAALLFVNGMVCEAQVVSYVEGTVRPPLKIGDRVALGDTVSADRSALIVIESETAPLAPKGCVWFMVVGNGAKGQVPRNSGADCTGSSNNVLGRARATAVSEMFLLPGGKPDGKEAAGDFQGAVAAARKSGGGRGVRGVAPRGLAATAAAAAVNTDLTGRWRCNDGGTYSIRQIGNQLWWSGTSADGRSWSNVFHGTINGSIVSGSWADVPPGQTRNSGDMTLRVVNPNLLRMEGPPSAFGGTEWTR